MVTAGSHRRKGVERKREGQGCGDQLIPLDLKASKRESVKSGGDNTGKREPHEVSGRRLCSVGISLGEAPFPWTDRRVPAPSAPTTPPAGRIPHPGKRVTVCGQRLEQVQQLGAAQMKRARPGRGLLRGGGKSGRTQDSEQRLWAWEPAHSALSSLDVATEGLKARADRPDQATGWGARQGGAACPSGALTPLREQPCAGPCAAYFPRDTEGLKAHEVEWGRESAAESERLQRPRAPGFLRGSGCRALGSIRSSAVGGATWDAEGGRLSVLPGALGGGGDLTEVVSTLGREGVFLSGPDGQPQVSSDPAGQGVFTEPDPRSVSSGPTADGLPGVHMSGRSSWSWLGHLEPCPFSCPHAAPALLPALHPWRQAARNPVLHPGLGLLPILLKRPEAGPPLPRERPGTRAVASLDTWGRRAWV
ncbi:hypothetical protein Cadr_000010647 [Camelus dromedarius]|uniref:Uncharacterized protein n=1 Tax=Camelus dromedarius TaxID=9838 RepID=A0A5N4DX96_CAMDR|nr:hypothetical protein Cadr_000010647 [Camelus dromedarius]